MDSIGILLAQAAGAAGGVAGFLLGATGIVVCLVIMWMRRRK